MINALQVAGILRSLYTSGKKPHQIAYLLLLHYKKDLSVDELTYFMDGFYTPSGKPIDRRNVYAHLYALDKSDYVYKEKMIGESGHVCNVYYIAAKGREVIEPLLRLIDSWDSFREASSLNGFFGTIKSYTPISSAKH